MDKRGGLKIAGSLSKKRDHHDDDMMMFDGLKDGSRLGLLI